MYKRKDGRYQQKVKIGGRWVAFAGPSQKAVLEKIRKAELTEQSKETFRSIAEDFEIWRFEDLAPGTLQVYRPALHAAVDRFGDQPIAQISPRDVSLYLGDLARRYAAKTVSNYRGVLSQVFDYAVNQKGCIASNPCRIVRTPPSRIPKKERQPLTDAQRAEIEKTQPGEFLLAFLIINTGCRLGEACALQWSDIDFDDNLIRITKAVHWNGNAPYIGKLKTKNAARVIPLLSPLRDMLLKIRPGTRSGDYVLSGSSPLMYSQIESRWRDFCVAHGLAHAVKRTWKTHGKAREHLDWICDIDRHQLRHDFATSLFRAGLPVKAAQHILGHSDYSTTMDIYTHWIRESVEDSRLQLEQFLAQKKGPQEYQQGPSS